jgi:hypothetical protein
MKGREKVGSERRRRKQTLPTPRCYVRISTEGRGKSCIAEPDQYPDPAIHNYLNMKIGPFLPIP